MPTTLTTELEIFTVTGQHFRPDQEASPKNRVLFCLPGGGASAAYFNLTKTHSFARHMAGLGYDVITVDHIGTATNPLPENATFLTPKLAADRLYFALSDWLKTNDLRGKAVTGIGHSMGGVIISILQARHIVFDTLGLFGSSPGGLEWGLTDEEKDYIDDQDAFERDLKTLTLGKFKSEFPEGSGGPSGKSITFGGETPQLTQALRDVSCALYAAGGMTSMTRGSFKREVDLLDIPIYFVFGDHDIGIPPNEVAQEYPNIPSSELRVLNNTGHNHFAFSSLTTLCQGLDIWLSNVA